VGYATVVPRPIDLPVLGAVSLPLLLGIGLGSAAVAGNESPVTQEWFRYDCRSELSSEDLTLFGNGTLRLRRGFEDRRTMQLVELESEELQHLRTRLDGLAFEDGETFGSGVSGEWVDQCTLDVDLPGRSAQRFRFHRLDSLSLDLQRAVDLGQELIELAAQRAPYSGLPRDYEPMPGDYLLRGIGGVFEVIGLTSDGRGVELVGIDQPLLIFVAADDLRSVFVELLDDPEL